MSLLEIREPILINFSFSVVPDKSFLTSFSLVLVSNKEFKKESILDSSDDSIIDRLDLIPEEFDVEKKIEKVDPVVPTE